MQRIQKLLVYRNFFGLGLILGMLTACMSYDMQVQKPMLEFVKQASGCGDLFVYKSNRGRSEYISVWVNVRTLNVSSDAVAFDLVEYPDAIGARIDVYTDNVDKLGLSYYCNDVSQTVDPHSIWHAVSGTVTVSVSGIIPNEPCVGETYQTTILVEDVVFELGEDSVHLATLEFNDVTVGWCPG